jgi:hypothetical protein
VAKKTSRLLWITVAALPLALHSCRSSDGPPEFLYGQADVMSVEIQMLGTQPIPVQAVVRGTLPDACTKLGSVKQEVRGATFILTFTTRRPIDEICVQGLTPFEATVPLAVEGQLAGIYTVMANGVTSSFQLTPEMVVPLR